MSSVCVHARAHVCACVRAHTHFQVPPLLSLLGEQAFKTSFYSFILCEAFLYPEKNEEWKSCFSAFVKFFISALRNHSIFAQSLVIQGSGALVLMLMLACGSWHRHGPAGDGLGWG